jgi:hypothetical protein
MEFQGFPKIPRYSRDCVITEKIDGTNGQILFDPVMGPIEDYEALFGIPNLYTYCGEQKVALWVGSRKRFITSLDDNFGFAKWACDNLTELTKLGPGRHFGEWWGQGIQRGYGLKEKRFSLFNVKKWNEPSIRPACCSVVPTIAMGTFDTRLIEQALLLLKEFGSYAAPGFMNPEGIVVFHSAGSLLFKKTLVGDEKGKGE